MSPFYSWKSLQGGGNADRLRRAEASTVANRRGVQTTRQSASRSRRETTRSGRSKLPLGTRTARRSHPQETQTAPEGSDGGHCPAAPPFRRSGIDDARLNDRRPTSRRPDAPRGFWAYPAFV